MKQYSFFLLFLFIGIEMLQGQSKSFSTNSKLPEPYQSISGKLSGKGIPGSPDPLVGYKWKKTSAADNLEIYILHPKSISSNFPGNLQLGKGNTLPIKVNGACDLLFDFGRENAGWLE